MSSQIARIIARYAKRPSSSFDAIDAQAEREGAALEYMMVEVTGKGVPLHPHVVIGLQISAAMERHSAQPTLFPNPIIDPPARKRGHFDKQMCMKIVERAVAGGAGQKEIVTRQDLARRKVQAAARRLDVLAAQSRNTSKVERDAMRIAKLLLRQTPQHAMSR